MYEIFFALGFTILAGFAALALFERTRISQVLLLMLFGFILGPLLQFIDASPDSVIVSMLPFLSTLALIVLLFDGGMMLDIFSVARAIPRSTAFALLAFALGAALVSLFMTFVMGWPFLYSLLLGLVMGSTSSAIVISLVEKAHIKKETRSLLTVESTITDALCIITAVVVMHMILAGPAPPAGTVANLLLASFTISFLVGFASAIAWMFIMRRFAVERCSYMLTLALVFGVYAVTEAMQASGPFAVFIFGLVLGNAQELEKIFGWRGKLPVSPRIRLFQEEVTFFVRTFFFVYIGLLLSPSFFSAYVLLVSLVLLILLALARLAAQRLLLSDLLERDRRIVVAMLPRGLAAAVLATVVVSSGIRIGNFQELVFIVILLSNIAVTAGIFFFDKEEKKKPTKEEAMAEAIEELENGEEPEEEDEKAPGEI